MKKIQLNIEDIFNVPSAVIYSPDDLKAVSRITIDSRRVKKNSLFIAIKGRRFDGHDFVTNAIKNGAHAVVICQNKLAQFDAVNVPIITVSDTITALGDIAKIWRRKLNAKIVAITGSSGKTTVKDILADLLSEKYSVNKTLDNNNNHIGVPLTILNTNERHHILVAELGTNHFGEIPYTSKIISPDFALITNVGSSHLKFLNNNRGVWKEKSALFDETIRNKGKIFLNYDDPLIKKYKVRRELAVKYSMKYQTRVRGKIKKFTQDGRPIVELIRMGKKIKSELPLYGEQGAKNFLAAAAVALELGISKSNLQNGLKKITMPAGRMNVIRSKNFFLIDDTYNANPESVKSAIGLVSRIKTYKRKILFLGDMLELGKFEIKLHADLAQIINKSRINEVYTIGKRMKRLGEKLDKKNTTVKHFQNRNSLIKQIQTMDLNHSVILVKGSRGMNMEDFLRAIIASAG